MQNIDVTWQPRRVDRNAHVWTVVISLYQSLGAVNTLSDYMYCVAVTFKMIELVEQQQICIKFCIKLEHSSMETIQMIQKATAMGNWWLAASTRQHACSCIISCAEFFGKTSNHPGDSAPPHSPDLAPYHFWLFPKLKSPLKGKRFQTIDEIQENTLGPLMAIPTKDYRVFWVVERHWKNCVRSPGAYFEGD